MSKILSDSNLSNNGFDLKLATCKNAASSCVCISFKSNAIYPLCAASNNIEESAVCFVLYKLISTRLTITTKINDKYKIISHGCSSSSGYYNIYFTCASLYSSVKRLAIAMVKSIKEPNLKECKDLIKDEFSDYEAENLDKFIKKVLSSISNKLIVSITGKHIIKTKYINGMTGKEKLEEIIDGLQNNINKFPKINSEVKSTSAKNYDNYKYKYSVNVASGIYGYFAFKYLLMKGNKFLALGNGEIKSLNPIKGLDNKEWIKNYIIKSLDVKDENCIYHNAIINGLCSPMSIKTLPTKSEITSELNKM